MLNRRKFLLLGATFAASCGSLPTFASGTTATRVFNAGPVSQYLADGVYARYRDLGFFLVRRGARLFALSAICTHRKCKPDAEPDKSFYCPCHGSTFDADGKVTEGPAKKNLPVFEISTNENGELLVKIPV